MPGYNKFHKYNECGTCFCYRNYKRNKCECDKFEVNDYNLLSSIENNIICNSYIKAGKIMTSPIKYLARVICKDCDVKKSIKLTFDEMFDGKKILTKCPRHRK